MRSRTGFNVFAALMSFVGLVLVLFTITQIHHIGVRTTAINFSDVVAAIAIGLLGLLYALSIFVWAVAGRQAAHRKSDIAAWAWIAGGLAAFVSLPFANALIRKSQSRGAGPEERSYLEAAGHAFRFLDGWMYPFAFWPIVALVVMVIWWARTAPPD